MARNLVEIPLQIACEAKVANITSSHKDMGPLEGEAWSCHIRAQDLILWTILEQVPIAISARPEGQRCVEVETRGPIH